MYARFEPHLRQTLERRVRRIRITSALKYYPIGVVIFTFCAVFFLFLKAHSLLRLVINAFDGSFTEKEVIVGIVISVTVAVSVVLIFILRGIIQRSIFEERYFCGPCNAIDKDDEGTCPFCNQPLKNKATFFFTLYEDEIQLTESFGLRPANEYSLLSEVD
jgi:hypothetical protein